MDLFDLFAKLTLDSSEYESGLDKAEGKASSFGSKLKSGLGTAAKVGAAGLAAMAGATVGAATAMAKSVSATAEYGDNIDKMSQKMGFSAQAYQEWDAIMQHAGANIDSVAASTKTLSSAVVNGSEEFAKLGLNVEDLQQMSKEDIFATTITSLQNIENETERTAIASKLLGRGAVELGALLNTSSEETETMRQRVHELGGVMSDDAVKASAGFQDNLYDLQTAMAGVKRSITAELLPGFNDVLAGLTSMIAGEDGAEEQLTGGIDNIITSFNAMLPRVSDAISGIGGSLISALPKVVEGALTLVQSLGEALIQNAPMLIDSALQIVQVLVNGLAESAPALATGAVGLITQLATMLTDPGTLGTLLSGAVAIVQGLATGLIQAVPQLISAIPTIINNLVTFIVQAAPQLIVAGGQLLIQLAVGLIQAIPQLLSALPEIVGSLAQGLIDLAPNLLDAGKELAKSAWEGIKSIFKGGDKADASESVDFSGIEEKSQTAASAVSTAFADMSNTVSFTQVGTDAQTAFSGIGTSAESAATSVTTSFANVGTGISTALSSASTGANFNAVTANAQQAAQQTIAAFSTVPEGLGDNWEATQSIYKETPAFFKKTFESAKENTLAVWGGLPDEFKAVWEQIKNVYKEAPTWFQTTFNEVKDNVTQIMGDLATDATTWGQDMMDNFNTGIQNRQANLNQTLNNVAQSVDDTIGFSEPKRGPLSDFHTFAPDMMDLFMQGIRDNTPALRKTVERSFDFRESFRAPTATVTTSRSVDNSGAKMDAILAILQQYLPELVNRDIILDSGATVGALLPQIDSGLGSNYTYKARGNA